MSATTGDTGQTQVTSSALRIDGLSAGYDRSTILRDITLNVGASQVTALLGPNGAGKTTLLRTVSGFLAPTTGSITLFDEDITTMPAYRRAQRGLCHVPEGRGVFRSLTVRENLVMQAAKGGEEEAIERAASAFPVLGERLTQIAGTLSGGQQQMLAIASAYVQQPRLVLIDEASLGLAPLVVDEIFAFIKQIAATGTAVLLIDQFVTRALEMSTEAYILRRGQIVHHGPSAELLDDAMFSRYMGTEE